MHHLGDAIDTCVSLPYNSGARPARHLYLIHNFLSFAIAAQKRSQTTDLGLHHGVTELHANPFVANEYD